MSKIVQRGGKIRLKGFAEREMHTILDLIRLDLTIGTNEGNTASIRYMIIPKVLERRC